jgi:hypothetical protein
MQVRLALAAIVVAAGAILVAEAVGDSVTIDEFAHLPAGVYYLETGRFGVYNLSPPLLRELAALPVMLAHPAGDLAAVAARADHWAVGYEFMQANAARYHFLFVLARLPMIALTLALVVAVFACGRRHLGARAGLAAAALAAFCPTVLAHGHLVGTDTGATLAMFLASWAALEALRTPSLGRTLLLGLALGVAQLTKFSALALYPTTLALGIVASARGPRRWQPFATVGVALAVSLLVVNVGYLGRGSGAPLSSYTLTSPDLQAVATGRIGRLPLPLPGDFVTGFDRQHQEAGGVYPVYFHGTWSTRGWWYYYPAAFALKETLPMLVLLGMGIAVLVAGRATGDALVVSFLVVPALLFTIAFAALTDINLGVRYLLPAYPFVFLLAACPLADRMAGRQWLGIAASVTCLHVAIGAVATPCHLAYMNALAGPADTRYRWLVDSNLDWGQELGRLHSYLAARGVTTVQLAYFGRVDPELYGIDYVVPRGPLAHGTFAVSASFVAGRPYFVYDHGRLYGAPADAFAAFRDRQPTAVIGHSLLVYDF